MKNIFHKSVASSLSLALLLGSAGCGGGSDSAGGSVANAFHGIGFDGILVGSTVCIDANQNGLCDVGEPFDTTDAQGKFNIASTTVTGPLLLVGGTDNGTGQAFTGTLSAPAGSTVVTPITSAVQALVRGGKTSAEATANVKAALGLPTAIDINNFDPFAASIDTNTTNSGYAKTVLAKQTQLQVLVHSAAVTVAGADTGTDVNQTMGTVFDKIAANFSGATGAVVLDAAKMTAATKAVADSVYAKNSTAKVTVKTVAATAATTAVTDADSAEATITAGTPAQAVDNLNTAITKVNTTTETSLKKAATAATAALEVAKTNDSNYLANLEKAQDDSQKKEEATALAKVAAEKADADLAAAQKAANDAAEDRAKYEAYLAAKAAAEKAASEKALADKEEATAQAAAALLEKSIDANAAQRESDAQAAKAQAEAEEVAAKARQDAAEKAEEAAKNASDLTKAKEAADAEDAIALNGISQAEVKKYAQIANFFQVQAIRDANETQAIADLNVTGTLVDANVSTANSALALVKSATSSAIALADANSTDVNTTLAYKDTAKTQADIVAQTLKSARQIKATAENTAAAAAALVVKKERINIVFSDINQTKTAATNLFDVNGSALFKSINADMTTILTIGSQYTTAGSKVSDANATAALALKAYNDANASFVLLNTAYTDAQQAVLDVNETAIAQVKVKIDAEKTKLDGFFKTTKEKAAEILGLKTEVEGIRDIEIEKEQKQTEEAIKASAEAAQVSVNIAIQAANDANATATTAGVNAQKVSEIATLNQAAASLLTTAQTAAQTAATVANEARDTAKLAGAKMTEVFVTNVADINQSVATEAEKQIASFAESAVDAKNRVTTAAATVAQALVDAQALPTASGGDSNTSTEGNTTTPTSDGGISEGMSLNFLETYNNELHVNNSKLSGGVFLDTTYDFNATSGNFVENTTAHYDKVLDSNGSWIDYPQDYTITNGVLSHVEGESKILKIIDLVSPADANDTAYIAKLNALIPGDSNISFTSGAQAYLFLDKLKEKYELWETPIDCADWNSTTNTCNVQSTTFATLLAYMSSNNSPDGENNATGEWIGVNFQKDTNGLIDDANNTISTITAGLSGNLVTNVASTQTVVGTWTSVQLPNNAGIAVIARADANHTSAFSHPNEQILITVESGEVRKGVYTPVNNTFKPSISEYNFNDKAFEDIKTYLKNYVISHSSSGNSSTTKSLTHTSAGVLNGNFMYVTNEKTGTIYKIDENGTYSTFLTGYNGASGLVKNLLNDKFYFSDDNNKVYSFDENATVTEININPSLLSNPNALEINNNKLYIANAGSTIVRVNLADLNDTLVMVEGLNIPQAVRVSGTNLYFSDNNGSLYKVDKDATTTVSDASTLVVMNNLFLGGDNQGGIAIDSNQNIYLSNYAGGKIFRVNAPDYNTSTDIFNIAGTQPRGLFYRSEDESIYATIFNEATIIKIDLASSSAPLLFSTLNGTEGPFGIIIDYLNATDNNTTTGGSDSNTTTPIVNTPPVAQSDVTVTVLVNEVLRGKITATDADANDTLTFNVESLVGSFGSNTELNSSTGEFTVDVNATGDAHIVVRVSDENNSSDTTTLYLKVVNANINNNDYGYSKSDEVVSVSNFQTLTTLSIPGDTKLHSFWGVNKDNNGTQTLGHDTMEFNTTSHEVLFSNSAGQLPVWYDGDLSGETNASEGGTSFDVSNIVATIKIVETITDISTLSSKTGITMPTGSVAYKSINHFAKDEYDFWEEAKDYNTDKNGTVYNSLSTFVLVDNFAVYSKVNNARVLAFDKNTSFTASSGNLVELDISALRNGGTAFVVNSNAGTWNIRTDASINSGNSDIVVITPVDTNSFYRSIFVLDDFGVQGNSTNTVWKGELKLADRVEVEFLFNDTAAQAIVDDYNASQQSVLVDPYIVGATLCEDVNKNAICDSGEQNSSITTSNGQFTFSQALTPGSHIIIATQGTHEGKVYDVNLSAIVDANGTVNVVSPMTTLVSRGITNTQLAEILNKAAADNNLTAWNINAQDIGDNPLASGITGKTLGQFSDADLVKLQGSLIAYGMLRIMDGSSVLKSLSDNALFQSGMNTDGEGALNQIAQTVVFGVTQSLNHNNLLQIKTQLDSARTQIATGINNVVNNQVQADTLALAGLPEPTADLLIKVAVSMLDRLTTIGFETCNNTHGDFGAALQAVNSNFQAVSNQLSPLGQQYYGLVYRDNIDGLINATGGAIPLSVFPTDIQTGHNFASTVKTVRFNSSNVLVGE